MAKFSNQKFVLAFLILPMLFASCSKNSSTSIYNSITGTGQEVVSSTTKTTKLGEANLFAMENRGVGSLIIKGKMPDINSTDYYTVREFTKKDGTKKIIVTAKFLNITPGSIHNFYTKNTNVSEVLITAEKILVTIPVVFPGANIGIHANELQFLGQGKFDTTPLSFTTMPEIGKNGFKGKSAGDIVVDVKKLDLGDRDKARFVLRGGQGQAAGLGKPGINGKSINVLYDDVIRECVTTIDNCDREAGAREDTVCRGASEFPTRGEDAINGGVPGAGGNGGVLYNINNLDVTAEVVDTQIGSIGAIAPQVSGGNAGLPKISRIRNITKNASCPSKGGGKIGLSPRINKALAGDDVRTTIDGKKSTLKTSPVEQSQSGSIEVTDATIDTSDLSELIRINLEYAKDLYRNNYFSEAAKILSEIEPLYNEDGLKMTLTTVKLNEAKQLLNQLKSQKDFYGENLNLAPVVAFEASAAIYQEEIKNSFDIIAFSTRMKKTVKNADNHLQDLIEQKELLKDQVGLLKDSYDRAYNQIPELQTKIANTILQEELLQDALNRVEQQIEQEARDNLESAQDKSSLLGAVKLLATLARISPAGQPAAALIGTTIDKIVSDSQKKDLTWKDQINDARKAYLDLKNVNWEKSKGNWNEVYGKLINKKDQSTEAYLKNLYFTMMPLENAVATYNKDYIQKEVPRSEYEKEVKRIQAMSPVFKEAVARLNEVQKAKEETDKLLAQVTSTLIESQRNMVKNEAMMIALDSQSISFADGLNFSVEDVLTEMEKDAKARLLKYKVTFMKAYAYRTLTPYTGAIDLEEVQTVLNKFLEKSDGKELNVEDLKNIYKADLNKISSSIFDTIQSGNFKEYESAFNKELNSGEIAALNAGKTIYLDLTNEKEFRSTEENIRIISMEMGDFSVDNAVNAEGTLDFTASLVGASKLVKNNIEYSFVHANPTQNFNWKTRLDVTTGLAALNREAAENAGLLEMVMGSNEAGKNALIFNRVGGRSVFALKLDGDLEKSKLTYGKLNIKYSYSNK